MLADGFDRLGFNGRGSTSTMAPTVVEGATSSGLFDIDAM
jgi:hypothetical protein